MARRSLKYNAAILTVTGFIVKAIGFLYRVFIANSIGTEGLGLYQLMTPIYSLLVLVLSAGISVAVSRFVAEEASKGLKHTGVKITSISAGIVLAVGVVICGILLLNIDALVLGTTGDMRTKRSLFWILVFVPPIAAVSAFKGYFYGRQEMIPNSAGQITEQITKLLFVILMIGSFRGKGIESMCLLAVLAMLIGECANVLVVYIAFLFSNKRSLYELNSNRKENSGAMIKKIIKSALPISANRLVLSLIGTAESLLIPQRLVLSGLSFQESLKSFGRLTGMASPLVFFPSMLPMSLATALVPAIAGAVAAKQYRIANRQISQSIRLTIIMGLIFTSFFASCSSELAELVYPGKDVGSILRLLSFTGVFLYLQHTMLGILNGLARESAILINTLTGSIIRIAAIWFLMPILGVDAYIYAVIAGSIITIAFNFREISKITGISIDAGQWLIKPISAAMAGVFFTFIIKTVLINWNMQARIYRLLIVITAFLTLATIFIVTGIIKKDDLKRWIIRKH